MVALTYLINIETIFKKYESSIVSWEYDISVFDQLNETEEYPDDAILFAGRSSIRLWDNIEKDMAPYTVIQRGYGGAAYADLA